MSISYCSIYSTHEKILLAESTKYESYHLRVQNLLNSILAVKEILKSTEIEAGDVVSSFKTKKIIFICVSQGKNMDRSKRFLESFVSMIVSEFGGMESIPLDGISKLCFQTKLEDLLNKQIENFETGLTGSNELISEMKQDIVHIRSSLKHELIKMVDNTNNLDEMLLVSERIQLKAVEYKEDAKALEIETRCMKPWMVILLIVLLVITIVYCIFSFYLCGGLSMFCERKKNVIYY